MIKINQLTFVLLALFSTECAVAAEPENLGLLKQECIYYHDSGAYQRDIDSVVSQAMTYLKQTLAHPTQKKLAMVLDIDETSLSNYADMAKYHFGGTTQEQDDAAGSGHDPAIASTLALYRYAKAHQVAVFFITGRREHYRSGTVHNLFAAGYKGWDGLILKPESDTHVSAAPYKIAARKQIEAQGYKIILNIGDQESDLTGGYALKTFKLPNPFYVIV